MEKGWLEIGKPGGNWKGGRWRLGRSPKEIGNLELEAGETPEEKGIVWSWKLGKGLKKLEKGWLEIGKPGGNWKGGRWRLGRSPKEIGNLELEAGETPEEKGIVWSWQLGKGLKKLEKGWLEIGKPGGNWKGGRWRLGRSPKENRIPGVGSW